MKRFRVCINILICLSLGLWFIKALLDYNNYTRHVALFAANGWLWYTDVVAWGKYVLLVVAICLVAKYISRRK